MRTQTRTYSLKEALLVYIINSFDGLFKRHRIIRSMQIKNIDLLRIQSIQTLLELNGQVLLVESPRSKRINLS